MHVLYPVPEEVPDGSHHGRRPGKVWSIDRLRCIQCGACVEPCPKKCLALKEGYSPSVTSKSAEVFKPSPKPAAATEAPTA